MLFNISMSPDVTFEHVIQVNFNVPFIRRFTPDLLSGMRLRMKLPMWLENMIKNEIANMVLDS
jgi:hypothetical protein